MTHPVGSEMPTIRLGTYKLCIDWSVLLAIIETHFSFITELCDASWSKPFAIQKQYVGDDGLFAL